MLADNKQRSSNASIANASHPIVRGVMEKYRDTNDMLISK